MKYESIVNLISKQLGDEIVSKAEMLDYMDRVIDDINVRLNTCFPTFTEFQKSQLDIERPIEQDNAIDLDYTAIPDKYIRTVVVPGAAFKYYTTDEEGMYAAPKYEEDYRQGLFYMERDFSFSIPQEYRMDEQGYIDIEGMDQGLVLPSRGGMF